MFKDSSVGRDIAAAGLFLAALGGCVAIPAAATAVSTAFDGMSYVSTGKASHDHALSAVTGEDCAVWRVVKDKPLCVEPKGTGAHAITYGNGNNSNALAFAVPTMAPVGAAPEAAPEKEPDAVITTEALPAPRMAEPAPQVASAQATVPIAAAPVAASAPPLRAPVSKAAVTAAQPAVVRGTPRGVVRAPVRDSERKMLVVLGSFQDADRAATVSGANKGTRVVPVTVEGRKMYRVVAGPFDPQQAEALRRGSGERAWLLPL